MPSRLCCCRVAPTSLPLTLTAGLVGGGVQDNVLQDLQGVQDTLAHPETPQQELSAWVQSMGQGDLVKVHERFQRDAAASAADSHARHDLSDPAYLLQLKTFYEAVTEQAREQREQQLAQRQQRQDLDNRALAAAGIRKQATNMMRLAATKLKPLSVNAIVRISTTAIIDEQGTRELARRRLKQRPSCTDERWTAALYRVVHHRFMKSDRMEHGMHEYMVEPLFEVPSGASTSDFAQPKRQHFGTSRDAALLESERRHMDMVYDRASKMHLPYHTCAVCKDRYRSRKRVWYNRTQLNEVTAAAGSGERHAFASDNTLAAHMDQLRAAPSAVSLAPSAGSLAPGSMASPSAGSMASSAVSMASSAATMSGAPLHASHASHATTPASASTAAVRSAAGVLPGAPLQPTAPSLVSGAPRNRYLQRFH